MIRSLFICILVTFSMASKLTVDFESAQSQLLHNRSSRLPYRMTFSEIMRDIGADPSVIPEGVSITPQVAGQWQWVSQKTLTFTPDSPWKRGSFYVFRLHNSVESLEGKKLDATVVDTLQVGTFSYSVDVDSVISSAYPLNFTFTLPVDSSDLRSALRGLPDDIPIYSEDSLHFRLLPRHGWSGEHVTFLVSEKITPLDGNIPLSTNSEKSFIVNDSIEISGLFFVKNNNLIEVSVDDSLYLEDTYWLNFNRPLGEYSSSFITVNGEPYIDYNTGIRISDFVKPDQPCTVQIKAGLPSRDSAYFFYDTTLIFTGDYNRINPDIPELELENVSVVWEDTTYTLSEDVPLPLKRRFSLKIEGETDQSYGRIFNIDDLSIHSEDSIYRWEQDSISEYQKVIRPIELPQESPCTLVVAIGARSGYKQLKEEFRFPFITGKTEFASQLKAYDYEEGTPRWSSSEFNTSVKARLLPGVSSIPLQQYGNGTKVELRPVRIADIFHENRHDITREPWISKNIDDSPDSTRYFYRPLPLDDVLTPEGFGAFDVRIIEGIDTTRLQRTVVSDLSVQLHQGRREWMVSVNSLLNSAPISGAFVALYNTDGTGITQGVCDSNGICLFNTDSLLQDSIENEKFEGIAKVLVFHGEDSLLFTSNNFYKDYEIYEGNIRTERSLYKSGEMLYFTGTVRQQELSWKAIEPQLVEISVEWEGAEPWSDTVQLMGHGLFTDSILIPENISHKTYIIAATLLECKTIITGRFNVEDYRPRELRTSIQNEIPTLDSLHFTLSSSWLHGGKAVGSSYEWESTISHYNCGNLPYGYRWISNDFSHTNISYAGEGILDNRGETGIAIARMKLLPGSYVSLEATVVGSPVQSDRGTANYREPYSDQIRLGIRSKERYNQSDSTAIVGLVRHENGSIPKTQTVEMVLTHKRNEKRWTTNHVGLPAIVLDTIMDTIVNESVFTTDSGEITLPFHVLEPGKYYLSLTCSSAVEAQIDSFTLAESTQPHPFNGPVAQSDSSREWSIEMLDTSRNHYPDDTIEIKLTTEVDSSTVLLQLYREELLWNRRITITGQDTIIALPLDESMIPRCKLQATFISPLKKNGDRFLYHQPQRYAERNIYINLSAKDRKIPVEVTAERSSYAPGDTATITISIPLESSSATATIAVVDESVFRLRSAFEQNLFSLYYDGYGPFGWMYSDIRSRAAIYGAADYATLNDSSEIVQSKLSFLGSVPNRINDLLGSLMGGGGSNMSSFSERIYSTRKPSLSRGEPAQLFETNMLRLPKRTTALFRAPVSFDSLGKATVEVPLPGNLTSWRITATVATEDQFGEGSSNFSTNKPLMVRPQVLRFMRTGDSANIAFAVENRGGGIDTILAGSLWNGDTLLQEIVLEPDELRLCRVPLIAQEVGFPLLTIGAKGSASQDGIALPVPIISERVREVFAFGGSTTDTLIIPFESPSEPIDSGSLSLTLSTTRMEQLTEAVQYLFNYPYGCLEQQASRIMPLLDLADFADRFSLEMLEDSDEDVVIQKFLNNIDAFAKPSGGLAYWRSSTSKENYWLTLYVLDIMNKAEQQGYQIDNSVYEGAISFIEQRPDRDSRSSHSTYIESYTQQVLAETGRSDIRAMRDLYRIRRELSLPAKIALLKAYYARGASNRTIEKLQKNITGTVIESGRHSYFVQDESPWYDRCHVTPVRTTALALEALINTGARNSFDEPMIRWLSEQRRNGRWRTTQENMAVFRAFNAYTRAYEGDEPSLNAVAILADEIWSSDSLIARDARVTVESNDLVSKGEIDTVSIVATGKGRLYADLLLTRYPSGMIKPKGSGFVIERKLFLIDGDAMVQVDQTELTAGENYKVELTVVGAQDISFVAIDDPIPAGCEVINPEHNGTDQVLARSITRWRSRSSLSHSEFRDERVLLFADDYIAGETTYSYLMKATTPGQFSWPAPQVEAMYYPEFFAHGSEEVVVIIDSH